MKPLHESYKEFIQHRCCAVGRSKAKAQEMFPLLSTCWFGPWHGAHSGCVNQVKEYDNQVAHIEARNGKEVLQFFRLRSRVNLFPSPRGHMKCVSIALNSSLSLSLSVLHSSFRRENGSPAQRRDLKKRHWGTFHGTARPCQRKGPIFKLNRKRKCTLDKSRIINASARQKDTGELNGAIQEK